MNSIAILLFVVAAVVAEEFHIQTAEHLVKHRGECVEKLSIAEDQVTEYKKWNFPDDEKTKCYVKCIFEKMSLFDAATGFNIENLVQQLGQNRNKDEVRAEIVKCADKNEKGDDACVWVFRGFKCFKDAHLSLIQTSIKKD